MAHKRRGTPIHGWLVLDKPLGVTSSHAVLAVRRTLDATKAGHGGTLDPLATGVLPIALGEATKTVQWAIAGRKTYRFGLRWGEARATDDAEGAVTATSAVRPTTAAIEAVLPRFCGAVLQQPPAYSALKIEGARAYDRARAGETVELAPRMVEIDAVRLLARPDADHADFEAVVGQGTYIRALARDIGIALGTVAHVVALRRLAVGRFTLEQAISLDNLAALGHSAAAFEHLLPIETALDDIPALALSEAEAHRLRRGQTVILQRLCEGAHVDHLGTGATVCATTNGKLVALAEIIAGELRPVRVMNF
ncbi:MAG TPA: tRNA pseudouridine(55) synthase TruB [Stellaceae bacterium]|nr:tRNA pseudouridine(55) synthase TruB [Stellaceae bacterium]